MLFTDEETTGTEGSHIKLLNSFYALDRQIDELEEELWDAYLNDHLGLTPSPSNDPSLALMRGQAKKLLTRIQHSSE